MLPWAIAIVLIAMNSIIYDNVVSFHSDRPIVLAFNIRKTRI